MQFCAEEKCGWKSGHHECFSERWMGEATFEIALLKMMFHFVPCSKAS